MINKQHGYKKYIFSIFVFILCIALGIFLFFNAIQASIESNSKETLTNNVQRQSEHLNKILNINYSYLNVVAKEISKSTELFSNENLDQLKVLMDKTDLDRTALINPNGDALYDNGVQKNVAHRRYFQEAIQGKQTLSDPLESSVDNQTRVILGVPIFKENQVVGILGGSYNVTKLSNMLFDDLFDGQGHNFIMDEEGAIITKDKSFAKKYDIQNIQNIFEINGCNQDTMLKDLKKQRNGLITIQTQNHGNLYLAYSPLGINQWMVGYVVPIKIAQQSYSFITKYETIFITFFILFVLILILYLFSKTSVEKQRLLHAAQIDSLTDIYNKQTTQQLIDSKLKDDKPHCFLILDIDSFKQINDQFGHAIGDIVLQKLGELFKNHFRQEDIVGRIGGDEFIVLLQNENLAKDRIESLISKVEHLDIPQLNHHPLSISVGVAFSPKDGNSFLELYRNADNALYNTKRNGKNGYNIYKKNEENK